MNDIDSAERYACSNCWSKVEVFHEFYVMVETNYQNNPNVIDTKYSINPLFDCEPEIIVDEAVHVKTENDELESCVPDNKNAPSTSNWDSSVHLIGSYKDETIVLERNAISKKFLIPNQETVIFGLLHKSKRKRESKSRKRKKDAKLKLPFDESKKQKNIQQITPNISEIE